MSKLAVANHRFPPLHTWAHGHISGIRKLAVLLFLATPAALIATVPESKSLPIDQSTFDWLSFAAPFHAVLLHFPFGFIAIACLLEFVFWRKPRPVLRDVMVWLMPLSVVCLFIVTVLGLFLAREGDYNPALTVAHRNYGFAVSCVAALAICALMLDKRGKRRWWTLCFRGLLLLDFGLLLVAGHSGGNLTHGSTFLTKNAPDFVRELLEDSKAGTSSSASLNLTGGDQSQGLFAKEVEPIMRKHCLKCHGPEKQKGDYRVDDMKLLFSGGESEETAIVPGDPASSKLVHGILLPEDDDDVMPPEGKGHLNDDEILVIIKWIQKGAIIRKHRK